MADLRATPVNRSRLPGYPTKLQARIDPRLLRDHVPAAWRSRGEIAGLLGVMLAANSAGCSEGGTAASGETHGRAAAVSNRLSDPSLLPAVVAPLFEHGDGSFLSRGVRITSAVSAPFFLSEEEAIALITEELARHGLSISSRNVTLDSVIIDGREYRRVYDWVGDQLDGRWVDISEPLEVDLFDEETGIAVEFLSHDDFDRLGGNGDEWRSRLPDLALTVGGEVRKHGRGMHFAVLYDPVTRVRFRDILLRDPQEDGASTVFPSVNLDPEAVWESYRDARDKADAKARAESAQLLREQVKDFVDWLKGQGVI